MMASLCSFHPAPLLVLLNDSAIEHAGSIFTTKRRKRVPYLIWVAAVLVVAEIVFEGTI